MIFHSFDELVEATRTMKTRARIALAAAADSHSLEALFRAVDDGLAEPVLVGDRTEILKILDDLKRSVRDEDIYDVPDPAEACRKAVALVREGKAAVLMKGKVDTKFFLKAVVEKDKGLSRGRIMSHFSIFEVPSYHKLIVPVDGGMVPYPTLEDKKAIIENTVEVMHRLGYEDPKVGVLACVEKVNPKMIETVEADELAGMNKRGEITGCTVAGPISFDCAVNAEIAKLKGYDDPVAGDADILIAPNIHAGNIIGKLLVCFSGARMAGFIAGAACPVIMTSRGSSSDEKYYSIVLAAKAWKEV